MSLRSVMWVLLLLAMAGAALAQPVPLVHSSSPVSIGLSMQAGLYRADLEVREATTVALFCPTRPGCISLAGLTHKADVSYDQNARTLSISLQPGKYVITIRSL